MSYTYYDASGCGAGTFYRLTDKTAEFLLQLWNGKWVWRESYCTYAQTLSALLDGGQAKPITEQVMNTFLRKQGVKEA